MKHFLFLLLMMTALSVKGQNALIHIVQKGETLEKIAKMYKTTVSDIQAGNPESKSGIYVGMRLEILVRDNSSSYESSSQSMTPHALIDYSYTPQNEQQKNQTEDSKSVSSKEGIVGGEDYFFMLDPDNKYYGIRASFCTKHMIGLTLAFQWQAMSHGSYGSIAGIGFFPRYAVGPVIMGLYLYPYISFESYSVYEGPNQYGVDIYKDKSKVSYGVILDFEAGIKLWTTTKGKGIYLTGSYEISAPEFKTDNTFKHGLWGIGISITDI